MVEKKGKNSLYLILLFLLFSFFRTQAQSDDTILRYVSMQKQTSCLRYNCGYWSVSLSGGVNTYFGEKDLSFGANLNERLSPFGKLAVTRWITSAWGFRAQIDGGIFRNQAVKEEDNENKGKFKFMDGYVQFITNILNWGVYKRSDRPVGLYLYGGGGMVWSPGREYAIAQYSPGFILGGQFNIRMTDYWSLSLEGDGTIIKDNFNDHIGGRKYEGYASLSLGLTYRFDYHLRKK